MKKQRIYYFCTYMFGYFISLMLSGIPKVYYLVPIKVMGIIFAILLGNSFYYSKEQGFNFQKVVLLNIRNSIIIAILLFLVLVMKDVLGNNNIDISFITAPF